MALKVFREGQEEENESSRTDMSAVLIHAVGPCNFPLLKQDSHRGSFPTLVTPREAQGS